MSQCSFSATASQSLVAINSTNPKGSSSSDSSSGSSTGRTVGIAVGVTVGVVLITAAIVTFLLLRRRKRHQQANRNDENEARIRQGYGKAEMGTGMDNERYEMAGSDPQSKKYQDQNVPEWVDEKARFPRHHSDTAEVEGGSATGIHELGAPRTYGRHLHEMDNSSTSQVRYELPAEPPREELQGSTPGSSMPGSPVSPNTRRWSRSLRSPFSKPSSPLVSQASSSPQPSPVTPNHRQTQSQTSRFSLLDNIRRNLSSSPSAPASPPPPGAATPAQTPQPSNNIRAQGRDIHAPTPSSPSSSSQQHMFSPVSRRGTFERSRTPSSGVDDHHAQISPQVPPPAQGGLFDRMRGSP